MPIFNPSGSLNVSWDSSELPDDGLVRCKNLRINQRGKPTTRDGSAKINATALNTAIWWIEEMSGNRYVFAGTNVYRNETSINAAVTSAQWSAIQYNAFNDTTETIFALNGTDRKRITGSSVNEWGLAAPTVAPTISTGAGSGLTGEYNVRYTYIRKVGSAIVAESNPSEFAVNPIVLSNQSLAVSIGTPSDSQVTHARLYRTLAGGTIFYLDTEIAVSTSIAYGFSEQFEDDDGYISGTGYKFTIEDDTNGTENTYTWEETHETQEETEEGSGTPPYIEDNPYGEGHWALEEGQDLP